MADIQRTQATVIDASKHGKTKNENDFVVLVLEGANGFFEATRFNATKEHVMPFIGERVESLIKTEQRDNSTQYTMIGQLKKAA